MFISKKLHNKIVRAKEDEIRSLEDKIENRDILIADLQAENLAIHDESKDVRFENEEQKLFIDKIIRLATCNKYQNEKIFVKKIKELISDYHSQN